jgi:nifR3 family TIM-barrel protein
MMKEPDKMVEMTRQIVNAVNIPVTVKTRLGWDENSLIICELAEKLQDVGIAALTIHGRTRSQLYKGVADWTLIGELKKNKRIHIPITGNGDVNSPEVAKERFESYGVDAIMIGRATYGRPWIFRDIKYYLEKREILPEPDVDERVKIAKTHFLKSIEVKGERVGVLEMRRHLSSYFKGLHDFKDTRLKLVTENEPEKVLKLLDYIGKRWGNGE